MPLWTARVEHRTATTVTEIWNNPEDENFSNGLPSYPGYNKELVWGMFALPSILFSTEESKHYLKKIDLPGHGDSHSPIWAFSVIRKVGRKGDGLHEPKACLFSLRIPKVKVSMCFLFPGKWRNAHRHILWRRYMKFFMPAFQLSWEIASTEWSLNINYDNWKIMGKCVSSQLHDIWKHTKIHFFEVKDGWCQLLCIIFSPNSHVDTVVPYEVELHSCNDPFNSCTHSLKS